MRQDLEGRNLDDVITCRRTLMKLPSYERATLSLTKIPYLPNRKYFMANSIMEYFPEFSSDFSDFTLSVRLRVSNCMFGSRFNRLPAEAAFLDHRWALELVGPKRINTHIWVFLYLTPILYNIVLSFTLCKNLARMTSTNQNMAGKEVTSGKRRMQRGKSGKMSLTMANTNVMPR